MALSEVTVSLNLKDKVGDVFDPRRTKAWTTTSVDVVHDTTGHQTRVGSGNATVGADGVVTWDVWIPGAGSNPIDWQTTFHVDFPDRNEPRGRKVLSFGPFTVTAAGWIDSLAEEQAVPPTYLTRVTAQLDTYVTEAKAARDQAVDISNISTSDAVMAAVQADPTSQFAIDQKATIAADDSIHTGTPNFRAGFISKPDYSPTNTIIMKPVTDTDPGVIEWAHDSPVGYLLHLVSRPNMGDQAALIGMGIDFDGVGLLLANKLNGAGMKVHNHATATAAAVGIQGVQESTAAYMMSLAQSVAGAAPLIHLYADGTRTAGQRTMLWSNSGGTIGYVEAGGLFVWTKESYFKQGLTTSPAIKIEANPAATANVFEVFIPSGGGTPLAINAAGMITTNHGVKLINNNATSENPLRVSNVSNVANVDTIRVVGASAQLGDQISIRANNGTTIQSRFNKDGVFMTRKTAAPADADLVAGEMSLWFDQTNGAAKLMVKAKQADGTVRTGSVALA